jgi:phage-related minor tail protein
MDLFQLWGTIGIKTADAFKAIDDVQQKVNGLATNMGTAMQSAGQKMQDVGQNVSNTGQQMATGISAPIAALGFAAGKLASDVQNSTSKISSSLGLTKKEAEELSKVSQDLWKDGFGENLAEVDAALVQVKQNMHDIGSGDELKQVTRDAMQLAQTTDADLNEVTRAANNLMKGFGVSSKDAFDMMAKGAQNGLNFSNEMFDNLAEYAPLWSQMGYSADEMFGILERGSKAGVYNLDYVNDVMKEFQIRVKDGSKATSDAFDQLSPEANKVWKAFNEGKATVSDVASTVVGELKGMDDQVLASQIGVGLFGTKWEDLESDAMYAMLGTTEAMKGFEGAMGDVQKASEETFGKKWKQFTRTAQHALLPIGTILLDVANEWLPKIAKAVEFVAGAFAGLPKSMQGTIVIGAALIALLGPLLMIFGTMVTGLGAVTSAFGGLTKGVGALGGKLGKMPGLIGKMFKAFGGAGAAQSAVDGLTDSLDTQNDACNNPKKKGKKPTPMDCGGCSMAAQCNSKDKKGKKGKGQSTPRPTPAPPTPVPNGPSGGQSGGKKNPFAKLAGFAKNAAKGVGKAFGGMGKMIARVGSMFLPMLANPMGLAIAAVVAIVAGAVYLIVKHWDSIKAGAIKAFTAIGDFFKKWGPTMLLVLSGPIGWIVALFVKNWDAIKKGTLKAFGAIGDFFKKWGPTILIALSGPIGWIVALFVKNWDDIKKFTEKFLKSIGEFFTDTFKAISEFMKDTLEWLSNFFSETWDAIQDVTEKVFKWIQNFLEDIWNSIKSFFNTVLNAIKSIFEKVWNAIKSFIENTMKAIQNVIQTVWNAIKSFIQTVLNAIKNIVQTVWNAIKSFIQTVMNAIKNIIQTVWNAIKSFISTVMNSIKSIITTVWNAIKSFISTVVNSIKNIIVSVWNSIKSFLSTVMNGIKNALVSAWNAIKSAVTSVVNGIKNAVVGAFNAIKNTAVSIGSSIKNALVGAFNAIKNGAKSALSGLGSLISSAFSGIKNLASDAWSWGKDIMSGLIGGLGSMMKNLKKKVKEVASAIGDKIKDFFGIHSPSRLMRGYGVNIGQGLAIGMEKTKSIIGAASDAMNNAVNTPEPMEIPVSAKMAQTGPMTALQAGGHAVPGQGGVTNETTTNNTDRGVTIQNAQFTLKVEKLQTAEDVAQLRKAIQNVVSDDLFGMAVRNV